MVDVQLTTNVTLNGGSIDVTVYEDVGNTGTVDNTETVTVGDGQNTYALTNLQGGSGNAYYVRENPSIQIATEDPTFHSAELEVPTKAKGSASASTSSSGAVTNAVADLSSGSASASTTASTKSVTTYVSVTAENSASSTASGVTGAPANAVTVLPDEDQPALGNGVEDEVAVDRETQVSDYGDVRLQIRETGESSWDSNTTGFAEHVLDHATLTDNFLYREDGEEYEVRGRTETEHVTGAWTDPVSIVTKFPGAANVRVDTKSATAVALLWDDNSDNEDGFIVERREQFHTGWGQWRELSDEPANTTSYTDDVLPETTYEYRIRAYTEHTTANSDALQTTSNDDGVSTDRVPADGWHVVVEDGSGNQYEPSIVGSPTFRPTLNGLPTVEVPVANPDRWDQPAFKEAPMRVYLDGERRPIDTFVTVDRSEAQAVLQGRGGSELRRRTERAYQSEAVHTASDGLATTETSYATDVDVPATETLTDQLLQSADTTSEFENRLLTSITSTTPVEIANGSATDLQTCWTVEGENYDRGGIEGKYAHSDYSGSSPTDGSGFGAGFNASGQYAEYDFTLDYDLPAGELDVQARLAGYGGDQTPPFSVYLDPDTDNYLLWDSAAVAFPDIKWTSILDTASSSTVDEAPALNAGTHTLRIECDGSDTDEHIMDVIAPLDTRFDYTFDNTVTTASDGSNYLDGPQWYPDQIDLVFEDAATAYSVTDGAVVSTWSSTGGNQQLAVSNDLGASWTTAANTSSLDTSFAERGGTLRFRARLSRDGSRTSTPATGYQAQSIDSYDLSADLDDVATLVNRSYDGSVADLLTDIAEYGDLTWEVRYNDGFEVIITRPGLRTAAVDPSLVDYSVTKDSGQIVTNAVVYGKAQPVAGEAVTANHGSAVDLTNDHLTETSEVVRDSSTGTTYARGVDYRLDEQAGTITTLASGAITDGQSLEVDYEHRSRGVFEADSHDGSAGRELSRTIPAATTDRACQQAALKIVQTGKAPRWTAEATIGAGLTDVPLSSALDLDGLPTRGETLEVWDVEDQPDGVSLQLGNRDSITEVVDDIQSRLKAVARLS